MNVRELLDKYGIYYEDDSHTSELLYLCPFHDDHNVGSASFNEEDEIFYCFSCGSGGSIYDFVAKLENVTREEAYRLVSSDFTEKRDYEKIVSIKKPVIRKTRQDLHSLRTYRVFVEKLCLRMFYNLFKAEANEAFVSRWISILSHISFKCSNDIAISEKDLLGLYGCFIGEINNEIK